MIPRIFSSSFRNGPTKNRAVMLSSVATLCAALALVIWIKLRVVGTVPRQVYADPPAQEADSQERSRARPPAAQSELPGLD